METARDEVESSISGSLVYLVQEEKFLITLDSEQSERGVTSLKARSPPCSHWPRSCSCPLELSACFVVGCDGELRAPLAQGRVVGILEEGLVRSIGGADVVFPAVRVVPIRDATSVIERQTVQAWQRLWKRVALASSCQAGEDAAAASDAWRQRSEYFERTCRELTRLARARDRDAHEATTRLVAARNAALKLRILLANALGGRMLCIKAGTVDESVCVAPEDCSSHDSSAAAMHAKQPFYTGQPLILWDEADSAWESTDHGTGERSWRWLTHDFFGRFRVPLSVPTALQSLPWMYIPIADDVGNALRVEEASASDTSSSLPAKTGRYVHTKPICLAPDVERAVRFRFAACQKTCRCIAETADENLSRSDEDAKHSSERSTSASCCVQCSAWALSWPGILEMTPAILEQWPTWRLQQDRSDETAFTLTVDGANHCYRAWSRHERDVIVACLRHWVELASAGANHSVSLIVTNTECLNTSERT